MVGWIHRISQLSLYTIEPRIHSFPGLSQLNFPKWQNCGFLEVHGENQFFSKSLYRLASGLLLSISSCCTYFMSKVSLSKTQECWKSPFVLLPNLFLENLHWQSKLRKDWTYPAADSWKLVLFVYKNSMWQTLECSWSLLSKIEKPRVVN